MLLSRLVAVSLCVVLLTAACGAERPELEAADPDGAQTAADGSDTTSVIIVGDEVTDDDAVATGEGGESATGLSARAVVTEPDPETTGDPSDLPPLVVLDTDMGPDIDDALALAMLHTYQDREQAEIAAVTVSRNSPLGARFSDAMNTWYGHPDIPIGIDRRSPHTMVEAGTYVTLADRFPNDIAQQGIPEGVTVLRQVLVRAMAEGRAVVIVQVGFSGNVAALLDSRPDDLSVLSGTELVSQSGAVLSIMAGSFKDRIEFNVVNDIPSARRVIEGWPGDMILSPFEVGYDLHYPYTAVRDRHGGDDILRLAYESTDYSWHVDAPPFYDMRTWDLTSVMEGVDPGAGWFPRSGWGQVTIDATGRTFFTEGSGRHQILVRSSISGQQFDQARNAMIDLVSSATPR